MNEQTSFTEAEAQLFFAKRFNGKTWELFNKKDRTPEENDRMLDYAHASLAHWRAAGTAVNVQRGEWMIARAWIHLGDGEQALRHAGRVAEVTASHPDLMEDFDFAFAYECQARAHALCGHTDEARRFITLAQKAGEAIADEEDRTIFFEDFNSGNWNGEK